MKNSAFVRKLHYYIFFCFISTSYDAHLWIRRRQSSVLGKCRSVLPSIFVCFLFYCWRRPQCLSESFSISQLPTSCLGKCLHYHIYHMPFHITLQDQHLYKLLLHLLVPSVALVTRFVLWRGQMPRFSISRYKINICTNCYRTYLCLAWRWSPVLCCEGDRCQASWIWSLQEFSLRFCCAVNASCCNMWSRSHMNMRTVSSSARLLTNSCVHTANTSLQLVTTTVLQYTGWGLVVGTKTL